MSLVYRILVRCPATGQVLDTGIATSGREALNSSLFEEGKTACAHCRQPHSLKEHGFYSVQVDTAAQSLWRPNP